jgi:elongator complex protein 1
LPLRKIKRSSLPEDLSSKKRYPEAARVLLDYSKDVRQAVIALVQGHNFSEARRIVSISVYHVFPAHVFKTTLLGLPELVTEIIHPAAFESRSQFAEDINDMREQLRKQVRRIQELRVKKMEEPGVFPKGCPLRAFTQ